MKSWTSIPFYLWKNTLRRWYEYPVSPISKILIPALLATLAALVLIFFAEIERELREQLNRNSAFVAIGTEFVPEDDASTLLTRSFEEEIIWSQRFGSGVKQVRQPLSVASYGARQNAPVISFSSMVEPMVPREDSSDVPSIWFLSSEPRESDERQELFFSERRIAAKYAPIPDWVQRDLSMDTVVAIPVEMAEPALRKGYICHTLASMKNLEEVRFFVSEFQAYHAAEGRQVKVLSSLKMLEELERISGIQLIVRSVIVAACGIILALTLGSLAWLEYRQEIHLMALLQSFGTQKIILILHLIMENLVLVLFGLMIIFTFWKPIYKWCKPNLMEMGFTTNRIPMIDSGDAWIILFSAIIGVILALLPVAYGMRKSPGLILQ